MKVIPLLDELAFREDRPHAEPLLVDDSGRVLRFSLRAGQRIKKHSAPHASVHITVLKGKGLFAGPDDHEQLLSVGDMVVFAPGEEHTVRALDEDLVFVALLPSVDEHRLNSGSAPPAPATDSYLE